MKIKMIEQNGSRIAEVLGDELLITTAASALDLLASVRYETDCDRILISKALVCEDFFILSTGLAGEILQKFVNYGGKLAIWGEYSRYTSKSLQDFIRESNRGEQFFFTATREEALEKLQHTR